MRGATSIPRLLIAAAGSGVGKTTTIIAALGARDLTVTSFKCGPYYLDPTSHARVSGGGVHNSGGRRRHARI